MTCPWCRSIVFFTIRNPMPTLVEKAGELSPVMKESKMRFWNSSGIPSPVSDTVIWQKGFPSCSIRVRVSNTSPLGEVYLKALDSRFPTDEVIFSVSIHRKTGSSGSLTWNVHPFIPAIWRKDSATSLTSSTISASDKRSFTIPASIFCT